MKPPTFIRPAYALLTAALLTGLAACGGGGGSGAKDPPSQKPPVTTPGDPITDPKDPPPTDGEPPVAGTRPIVTDIVTSNGQATNVPRNTIITANISLPTEGAGVDANTLAGNVILYRTSDGQLVDGTANIDGAGGTITFTPQPQLEGGLLAANTQYTFEVREGLKDTNRVPFEAFKANFTTGTQPTPAPPPVSFTAATVFPALEDASAEAPIASLAMSPYRTKLYGVTLAGQVIRWTVNKDTGALTNQQVLNLGDLRPDLAGRAIIGLAFEEPQAGKAQVLWISHNAPVYDPSGNPPPDFSGAISKLTISEGAAFDGTNVTIQDYIVGLPRSVKDHLTNSLTFGPDGMLYVSQGSNTSTGAPDPTWNPNGIHPERLLSGTVLQIDPARDVTGGPIDVQTEPDAANPASPGNYDPYTTDAPVKIFADGVRNAYDMVWHSNGSLYIPTNGGASGGYTPTNGTVPALKNAPTQKDFLFRTTLNERERANYYGHPVALRGHYVLNGGNPTAGVDIAEVVDDAINRKGYPVGVQPDPNFTPPVHEFGYNRSPNGIIEYKSRVFNEKLRNELLVVEYAGGMDVLVLNVGPDGGIEPPVASIGVELPSPNETPLVRPLDLTEDTDNGNLYIAELVAQPGQNQAPKSRIRLLKPNW